MHVVLIDCRASLPEIIIAFCDNAKCWFATLAPFTGAAPSLSAFYPGSSLRPALSSAFPSAQVSSGFAIELRRQTAHHSVGTGAAGKPATPAPHQQSRHGVERLRDRRQAVHRERIVRNPNEPCDRQVGPLMPTYREPPARGSVASPSCTASARRSTTTCTCTHA